MCGFSMNTDYEYKQLRKGIARITEKSAQTMPFITCFHFFSNFNSEGFRELHPSGVLSIKKFTSQ